MKQIRLGIIGVGNIGSAHVQSFLTGLCPEIELAAAADRRMAEKSPEKGARSGKGDASGNSAEGRK